MENLSIEDTNEVDGPYFIVHSSDDYSFVIKNVVDVLEKEHKISCKISERDFRPGRETITEIADMIKSCKKTVVVLTKSSMERQWVKYEILLALERSQHEKFIRLTALVFDDIAQKDISFGVLSNSMIVRVDQTRENWKKLMVDEISKNHEMKEILVMANLSVGQVWSHFMGYCNIVLPDLQEKLKASEWYKQNSSRFPLKEFNVITHNAQTYGRLTELDTERIKYEGQLEEIVALRGTYSTRRYNVSVYSVTDPKSKEVYYFTGQIPNSMSIMHKLEQASSFWYEKNENSGSSDAAELRISPEERSMQVIRFYFIMNRLLNHPKNKMCNNSTKLLQYDSGSAQSFADIILHEIKCELQKEGQDIPPPSNIDTASSEGTDTNADKDSTVFIDHIEDDDSEFFEAVSSFLRDNGFKICEEPTLGRTHFDNLEEGIKLAKWYVPLISARSLENKEFLLLNRKCLSVVHTSIETNELRVIPLLDGIDETELPQEIGWITYLKRNDENYQQRLLSVLEEKSTPMEATVPAADVHQGLAWAFVLNYLVPTLEDRISELEKLQQNYLDHRVYPKLIIAIPKSFKVKSLDKNEDGKTFIDERFKTLTEEEEHFVRKAVGGVADRHYQTHRFELKGEIQKYILSVESPNALLTLEEMTSRSDLSGLTDDKFKEEADKFCKLSENILKVSKVKQLAEFLYFDDGLAADLADKLLDVLEKKENWPP